MACRIAPLLLAAALVASCAPPVKWVGADRPPRDLDTVLKENPLAVGENIRAVRLLRNDHVEQLLVQVRYREPLHYHADSDLTVMMMRGKGVIRIGANETVLHAGDIVHVPRGIVHAYINDGPDVGVAFVAMSPPPGPADRVLVESGQTPASR